MNKLADSLLESVKVEEAGNVTMPKNTLKDTISVLNNSIVAMQKSKDKSM